MNAITETKDLKAAPNDLFYTVKRAVNALLGYYRHRQTMHELASLDDHLLDDIGVQRDHISARSMRGSEFTARGIELPRYLLR